MLIPESSPPRQRAEPLIQTGRLSRFVQVFEKRAEFLVGCKAGRTLTASLAQSGVFCLGLLEDG
jgi:hypothetical protein